MEKFTNIISPEDNVFYWNQNKNECKEDERVLSQRQILSPEQDRAIKLITISDNTLPVGSFKYSTHKYPSDIDIFENFSDCCFINKVKMNAKQKIQEIALNISKEKNIFLADFKCGYDNRYDIYIGEIVNGQVVDYSEILVKRDFLNLLNQRLVNKEEIDEIFKLLDKTITIETYDYISNFLKNYKIVRWDLKELINGYKILKNNYVLYLDNAITQNSVVKIDIWAPVDGRYIEITNWFLIERYFPDGTKQTLSKELNDYVTSLSQDVLHYSQGKDKNLLKMCKRMWSLSLYLSDNCTINKLAPLFSSDIANLNQIKSDCEVIVSILKSEYKVDMNYILREINDFKTRYDFNDIMLELINKILHCNKPLMIKFLNEFIDILKKFINDEMEIFIKQENINVSMYIDNIKNLKINKIKD